VTASPRSSRRPSNRDDADLGLIEALLRLTWGGVKAFARMLGRANGALRGRRLSRFAQAYQKDARRAPHHEDRGARQARIEATLRRWRSDVVPAVGRVAPNLKRCRIGARLTY